MSRFLWQGPCDLCGSSDAKSYYADETAYCFSCGAYFPREQKQRKPMSRWTLDEIENFPVASLSSRGISEQACKKYGVVQSVSPETGTKDRHVFFPSGVGSGYKRKNLQNKRDMEIIGSYVGLFGQHVFQQGGKFLILTEGEEDALSAWQIYYQQRGKDYTVCSIPNGSSLGGMDNEAVWEFITSFEGVLLAFDQDEPGWRAVDQFAEMYGPSVKLKYAEFDAKDVNELLAQGREQEFLNAVSRAKDYQPEVVVAGADISFDEISRPIQPGVQLTNFPELSRRLQGIRRKELTLVLGPSGTGKSTFTAEMGYELITKTDENVAWLFLEEGTIKAAQRLIALDNNVDLWQYRQNPTLIPEEDRKESYDKLINNGRTHFIDLKHGKIAIERLIPILRYYYYLQGCTRIIFDHISMVFAGDETTDERKALDKIFAELYAFVEETGASLIIVAHIKRMGQKMYVKDQENDAQWLIVEGDTGRGSGAFEQYAYNIVTLEPEWTESGERGRTRLNLRKNREVGSIGVTDIVRKNLNTGRLESLQEEF